MDRMTFQDVIDHLRNHYSRPIANLSPMDRLDYKQSYVMSLINEFERRIPMVTIGLDEFTELEKLGITLLLSSADLTLDVFKKEGQECG